MTTRPLVGVIGGGQLARMLALAGRQMGMNFRVLDPAPDACAGALGQHVVASLDDEEALARFAEGCDVITYDIESIEPRTLEVCARFAPVFPTTSSIAAAHDRLSQKQHLSSVGLDMPPWAIVNATSSCDPNSRAIEVPALRDVDATPALDQAIAKVGLPGVLKLARGGYDGRGQRVLRTQSDVQSAREWLTARPAIYEQLVPFSRELSIVAARGRDGSMAFYPLVQNTHVNGILFETLAPAPHVTTALQRSAEAAAAALMTGINHVGVLAIELFEVNGRLVPNEFATRVHNSGHWTIEGAHTSQFENHLRAILGFPLGDCAPLAHALMLNIYGQEPPVRELLAIPGAHLHLYAKSPRPPRKIGHLTLLADSFESLARHRGPAVSILKQYQEVSSCTPSSASREAPVRNRSTPSS